MRHTINAFEACETNAASGENSVSSMEPTGASSPSVPESELYRRIQAILPKESDSSHTQGCYNKGMLRWTLHKKVQNNPGDSLSLMWVLIKELEKAERWNNRKDIIPLLHTLMYALIQTVYIPDELYKRVYDFCKRLLTFPQPFCSIGLSCTRNICKEQASPGVTYQRMVIAEQRLKNDLYPFQERVFVLADPVVFSSSLSRVVGDDIEASVFSGASRESAPLLDHMCSTVQRSIQANMSPEHCHGPRLAKALKDMGQDVEHYFQEVLSAFEHCTDRETLRSRMHQMYHEVVRNTDPLPRGASCDSRLPNPDMSFYMWTEELDIWRELSKWFRSSSTSDSFSVSQDQDQDQDFDLGESHIEMLSDMTRLSVMSTDSGIERDLPLSPESCMDSTAFSSVCEQKKSDQISGKLVRKPGIKWRPTVKDGVFLMQDTLEGQACLGGKAPSVGRGLQRRAGSNAMKSPFPKQQRYFTAKIVAMGDDRVLGRLAKSYYFFRKREARRLFLTMKVNLQFYYIPVGTCKPHHSLIKEIPHPIMENDCSLGSYLSMVDPWYNCNINKLGSTITKLAKMQDSKSPTKDPFISDILSYYVRLGQQPVYFNIYFVKIHSLTGDSVEEVFLTHLGLEFPEFRHITASLKEKQKKNSSDVCGAMVSMNYNKVTLSGRDCNKGLSVRMVGAQVCAIPSSEAEDLNCLTLVFNETATKSKSNTAESRIRTNNIRIRSLESRLFTVTLDKDSRRVYKKVQSIEIVPCLDPGYCVQKTIKSKFHREEERDAGLSKYMSKGLPLAINTFAGIIN